MKFSVFGYIINIHIHHPKYYAIMNKHYNDVVGWTKDEEYAETIRRDAHCYLKQVSKKEFGGMT